MSVTRVKLLSFDNPQKFTIQFPNRIDECAIYNVAPKQGMEWPKEAVEILRHFLCNAREIWFHQLNTENKPPVGLVFFRDPKERIIMAKTILIKLNLGRCVSFVQERIELGKIKEIRNEGLALYDLPIDYLYFEQIPKEASIFVKPIHTTPRVINRPSAVNESGPSNKVAECAEELKKCRIRDSTMEAFFTSYIANKSEHNELIVCDNDYKRPYESALSNEMKRCKIGDSIPISFPSIHNADKADNSPVMETIIKSTNLLNDELEPAIGKTSAPLKLSEEISEFDGCVNEYKRPYENVLGNQMKRCKIGDSITNNEQTDGLSLLLNDTMCPILSKNTIINFQYHLGEEPLLVYAEFHPEPMKNLPFQQSINTYLKPSL